MFILKVENEGFVGGGATIACGGLGRDQEVGYYEGIGALKYINMSDDIVENGRDLSFGDLRGRRYLRKGGTYQDSTKNSTSFEIAGGVVSGNSKES